MNDLPKQKGTMRNVANTKSTQNLRALQRRCALSKSGQPEGGWDGSRALAKQRCSMYFEVGFVRSKTLKLVSVAISNSRRSIQSVQTRRDVKKERRCAVERSNQNPKITAGIL